MVRPFAESDTDELLDVWERASRVAHHFLDPEFFSVERQEIQQRWLPMAETVVVEQDHQIIGFLSLIGNEVGAIFVDPDHQGRGVGRSLMDWARQARPWLELDVFEENAIGRRFYEAYGFQEIGRHTNEATGHTEIRLRLD